MAVISNSSEERIKLDLYDKKIIFYLSQNSRMPLSELSKKLKISSPRLKYKIDRLNKEILSPAMFLNFPLLEIPSYIILIDKLSEEQIKSLFENDSIYFIMQSIGEFRWALNVVTENIEEFCNQELSNNYFEIKEIKKTYADNYNPFKLKIDSLSDKEDKKIILDKKDYSILRELIENPLEFSVEIQSKTGIDRQTIKKRLKLLEESNIIQKFRYSINLFKIGFSTYLFDIEVSPTKKKIILEAIREDNLSGFVFENLRGFTMHYLPENQEQLFGFIRKLEGVESRIKIKVMQNTERFKVDLVPPVVKDIFEKRINS